MALKKDKQKVLGETFDDARVKGFLDINPRDGENTDFLLLERAYRSMKADNFATFVGFFLEAGHDINATSNKGMSLLRIINEHQQSSDYIAALKNGGARV